MRRNNKALYEKIMSNIAREVKRVLNEEKTEIAVRNVYSQTWDSLKSMYWGIKKLKSDTIPSKVFDTLFKPKLIYKDVNGEDYELNKFEYVDELATVFSEYYRNDEEISEVQLQVHFGYIDVLKERGIIKEEQYMRYKSLMNKASEYVHNKDNGYTQTSFIVNRSKTLTLNIEYDSDMLYIYINNIDPVMLVETHQMLWRALKDYMNFLETNF